MDSAEVRKLISGNRFLTNRPNSMGFLSRKAVYVVDLIHNWHIIHTNCESSAIFKKTDFFELFWQGDAIAAD